MNKYLAKKSQFRNVLTIFFSQSCPCPMFMLMIEWRREKKIHLPDHFHYALYNHYVAHLEVERRRDICKIIWKCFKEFTRYLYQYSRGHFSKNLAISFHKTPFHSFIIIIRFLVNFLGHHANCNKCLTLWYFETTERFIFVYYFTKAFRKWID